MHHQMVHTFQLEGYGKCWCQTTHSQLFHFLHSLERWNNFTFYVCMFPFGRTEHGQEGAPQGPILFPYYFHCYKLSELLSVISSDLQCNVVGLMTSWFAYASFIMVQCVSIVINNIHLMHNTNVVQMTVMSWKMSRKYSDVELFSCFACTIHFLDPFSIDSYMIASADNQFLCFLHL